MITFISGGDGDNPVEKTFQANKSNLEDVISYLEHKLNARVVIYPRQFGLYIAALGSPTDPLIKSHNIGGSLQVYQNNALSEINPINALKVKGKAKNTFAELFDFEVNISSNEYAETEAVHSELVERAGGYKYYGDTVTSTSAETASEVENEVKRKLIDQIQQVTSGTIIADLYPNIKPFNRIRATPVCGSQAEYGTTPVTYEVQRVHHKVRPGDGQENTQTELTVGLYADRDDLEIQTEVKSV